MPRRYRIIFRSGVGQPADLLPWLRDLIDVLRRAGSDIDITVTIEQVDE